MMEISLELPQVRNTTTFPELKNLMKLKEKMGELSAQDEKRFRTLHRAVKSNFLSFLQN